MNAHKVIQLGMMWSGCMACLISAQAAQPLEAKLEGTQVSVTVNGKLFTAYKFAGEQKYPYFWPVAGPVSGESITTETSEPYPHHHSLFFGCDQVNGGNYWQDTNERGQIVSQGPAIETASGDQVVITDECLWRQPGKDPIIRDNRRITISAPDDKTRLIDFAITLTPLVDVHIEKTNHSLFSGRVVPALNVESGGVILNAEGKRNSDGNYGVASPWCDYSGVRNGVAEGLAIFQHPSNPWYPSKWFTRDYGFFSPTPLYWETLDLPKDKPFSLQYRVVAHGGDAAAADIAGLFAAYAGAQK